MDEAEQNEQVDFFVKKWLDAEGSEDKEMHQFWLDLLHDVLGADKRTFEVKFQPRVKFRKSKKKIDVFLPATRVLIEHKTREDKTLLARKGNQSGGGKLTPFQQAKRYDDNRIESEKARWIVTCDFDQFWIYDMNNPDHVSGEKHETVLLKDLPNELYRLKFLVGEMPHVEREEDVSVDAGQIIRDIYKDLLNKERENAKGEKLSPETLLSLNVFCVRLVFCLYAENSGLFGKWGAFGKYLEKYKHPTGGMMRQAFETLFKVLDTKDEERETVDYKRLTASDPDLENFPYVNGGLFRNKIEVPIISEEAQDKILNEASKKINWKGISPTIFGAIFEDTLNEETRDEGGMHYTPPEKIRKVIDPLFLNDLKKELEEIKKNSSRSGNDIVKDLEDFQEKLASLKFLDPACGSGNFLTETFRSIREIENEVILLRMQKCEVVRELVKVSINQFYGIEINDFAVAVAKTAMWIADCQMFAKLNDELEKLKAKLKANNEQIAKIEEDPDKTKRFLPLYTCANITEGDALDEHMDWERLEVEEGLFQRKEREDKGGKQREAVTYDYIFGNPPFIGARIMKAKKKNKKKKAETKENKTELELEAQAQVDKQKPELTNILGKYVKLSGDLDYVAGWFFRAAELLKGKQTRVAFVATNSITQGQQVAPMWKPLFEKLGIHIDFAYRSFQWESESIKVAAVYCVIIGFSSAPNEKPRIIYDGGNEIPAHNINAYLQDQNEPENIFIYDRHKVLCPKIAPKAVLGNTPNDDGNFLFTEEEKKEFEKKQPEAKKFLRKYMGAKEFVSGKPRWCLWLADATDAEIEDLPKTMQYVQERIDNVAEHRGDSPRKATNDKAKTKRATALFTEYQRQPKTKYLLIPRHSSGGRNYIPMGFCEPDIICSSATMAIPGATKFHFGVLTSDVHMAWMRSICGRLGIEYRYSGGIVYNNFPWAEATPEQIKKIEKTAQEILDVRKEFQDNGWTLEELYGEETDEAKNPKQKKTSKKKSRRTMPDKLREAHRANDVAVRELFGLQGCSEEEIVRKLLSEYHRLIKAELGPS